MLNLYLYIVVKNVVSIHMVESVISLSREYIFERTVSIHCDRECRIHTHGRECRISYPRVPESYLYVTAKNVVSIRMAKSVVSLSLGCFLWLVSTLGITLGCPPWSSAMDELRTTLECPP